MKIGIGTDMVCDRCGKRNDRHNFGCVKINCRRVDEGELVFARTHSGKSLLDVQEGVKRQVYGFSSMAVLTRMCGQKKLCELGDTTPEHDEKSPRPVNLKNIM
jgi:hypothetical protein